MFLIANRPLVPPIVTAEIGVQQVDTQNYKDGSISGLKIMSDTITDVKLLKVGAFTAEQPIVKDTATGNFKTVPFPASGSTLTQVKNAGVDDFTMASPFVADGNLHVNGLDLSAKVPANAKAVLLKIENDDNLNLQPNQGDMVGNGLIILTGGGGYARYEMILLDVTANDRKLDYTLGAGGTVCKVSVMGYLI